MRRTVKVMAGERSPSSGMLEQWRPYIWRDPARCSPARLARLAAHDDYIRSLESYWSQPFVNHKVRRVAA